MNEITDLDFKTVLTNSLDTPVRPVRMEDRKRVDEWTEENLDRIVTELKREYQEIYGHPPGKGIFLSEMPLCRFWKRLPPPPGFQIIPGRVVTTEGDDFLGVNDHTYARNPNNEIICFTPAQFNLRNPSKVPGARIMEYVKKAPGLVTWYPKRGIARVYGAVSDIGQQLNLHYITK